MSRGSGNNFRQSGGFSDDFVAPAVINDPAPLAGGSGKGGASAPGPVPMPSSGGKGGVQPMPGMGQPSINSMPAPNVFYASQGPAAISNFDNTGRLTDSTLLAQQAILGRQPVSYQPLLTPDNYQNFYSGNQGGGGNGGNTPLIKDFRDMATNFREEYARQEAANSGGGEGVDVGNGYGDGFGYDPYGTQTLAPVTTIDPNTGQVTSVSPGGTVASGMPGSTFGMGTISDDPTGPESEDGNGYGGGYGYGGGGGYDAEGGVADGIGDAGGGGYDAEGGVADGIGDAGGGGDGGGGGSKIVCTAMNHAYGFGSFRNSIWLTYSAQHMTKAHEAGYHALFLPLVDYGFKRGDGKLNMAVRKTLEWIARHRTKDLRAEMRGTKRDATGRVLRFVLEPLCFIVGKLKGY